MAAYVHISTKADRPSEAVGFSLGSLNFAPIAIYTRNELNEISPQVAEKAFEAYEYLQIVKLHELTSKEYAQFCVATSSAYHYFLEDAETRVLQKEYIEGISAHWRELIRLLETDPRFSGASSFS